MRHVFAEPATEQPTGSISGRPPAAAAWTGSTPLTAKRSKTSMLIRWCAMRGIGYADSGRGKQIRFGYVEPELEQLAVDARRAPPRIVGVHAPDQLADFAGHLRPSTVATASAKAKEAIAMPGHHRFGFDNYEGVIRTEYSRRSTVQNNRSSRLSLGGGFFRLNTASCCRSAAVSRAILWRGTKNTRM